VHRIEVNRHGQRRYLLRGNTFIGETIDEESDVLVAEFATVAFPLNDVGKQH
jgi:hypothetical protein